MRLTEHFDSSEFRCRCGCSCEEDWIEAIRKTAEILEALRFRINAKVDLCKYKAVTKDGALMDFPIVINCGVRCPAHNKAVGGTDGSYHLSVIDPSVREVAYGGAADTWVPGLPVKLWSQEVKGYFRGHILYIKKKIVHVDRRVGNTYYSEV